MNAANRGRSKFDSTSRTMKILRELEEPKNLELYKAQVDCIAEGLCMC